MKHFFRITSVLLFLSLWLSIGAKAQIQEFPHVDQNTDGSYEWWKVRQAFDSFIKNDSTNNFPMTDEEIENFVNDYFNGFGVIRYGEANSPELDTSDFNSMRKECILLLAEKNAQNQNQQEEEVTTEPKRIKKLTYKQLAIRIGLGGVIALILACIIFLLVKSRKKKDKPLVTNDNPSSNTNPDNNNGTSDVIIRRKTTSILHKQSLDDVVNNNNYMAINCSDFCNDSAVKTMYIKNSCILDIYNMYAEDLRNPNNPKEDGCMVLGRWVHNEKTDEYDVSLEEVIFPGDDAVFAEYELDFGGKIKVKVNEKRRKLIRETDLQYDLTCWVHSHPGLGVFFSNTDCSLHLLHKHPTHPKFLTAIVIDILTPQQELGVFTFKHDMSINSKADLKQYYSLEEWYKWAVASKRASVFVEEHYNTLENAKLRNNRCYNIQLSNSTIIDLDLIATNQNCNSLYFVHGFSSEQSDRITNVAVKIENADTLADNELVGCFKVVTHRSYPTIKNAVDNYLNKIKFVLVYSIADGMLTTIPVIFNDLCTDESYYGEQPLEELKIWTRRKR